MKKIKNKRFYTLQDISGYLGMNNRDIKIVCEDHGIQVQFRDSETVGRKQHQITRSGFLKFMKVVGYEKLEKDGVNYYAKKIKYMDEI